MLWLYALLPCKPYYKFSILALQFQAGIKCNLGQLKGLSTLKLQVNQKDMTAMYQNAIIALDDLSLANGSCAIDAHPYLDQVYRPGDADNRSSLSEEHVGSSAVFFDLEPAEPLVPSIVAQAPPQAPLGYMLWQGQKLLSNGAAPDQLLHIDGWKFARLQDVLNPDIHGLPGTVQPCSAETSVDLAVRRALVNEYVYTGAKEVDLKALRGYIKVCSEALAALDFEPPPHNANLAAGRWQHRQAVRITRDALREEIEVFLRENVLSRSDEYLGFEEPEHGLRPPMRVLRTKGYRWICNR